MAERESVLRDALNVAEEIERDQLIRRIRKAERLVFESCVDMQAWNRSHPNERQLTLEDMDTDGTLRAELAHLGIDIDAVWKRADGGSDG